MVYFIDNRMSLSFQMVSIIHKIKKGGNDDEEIIQN